MTSKNFRPRHWLIAAGLGCLFLFWSLSIVIFTYDPPIDPFITSMGLPTLEIVTVMGMGISLLGFFACLVVYAVQWLVTIISLWKPPPSRVEHA